MKRAIGLITILVLFGCATTGKLINLRLQMTKSEVTDAIGKPNVVRGALTNKYGQTIEVWEYALYKTDQDAAWKRHTFYWLYFYDDKLVQWGEAGDWQKEADRIYEVRFR